MDPRGATPALTGADPTGALSALAGRSRDGFPHLLAARERTQTALADLRERLDGVPRDPDVAVVLFGSWGRHEVTSGSDEDWSVLIDGPRRAEARPGPEDLEGRIGAGERRPAAGGAFAGAAACDDLVERVGLDADSNRLLTLRMLLLLESVSPLGADVHVRCRERVLDTYLREVDAFRPPRFFLNDLIRYWRTIAVDFEGKARADEGARWAARLAKLRTSRKVLFAGGLLPILLCHLHAAPEIPRFLAAQLAAPATDRLAQAFLRFDAVDAGLRALGAYDRWLGLLDDPAARAELESASRGAAEASAVFCEARRLGDELESGLLTLLFDTPLRALVREYGVF